MKVIFRLKSANLSNKEDYRSLALNIKNTWDNMKNLDAMYIPKDVEVYVVDDDSEAEVMFDGKQETGEVEPIPVEWMRSWAMKNWVKTKKCEFDIIVNKLIDDWREENVKG